MFSYHLRSRDGLNLDNIPTNLISLVVQVTDGDSSDNATVHIAVKDVNDREPVFERREYAAAVPENAEIGTQVQQVRATDADFGVNAEISYRIQRGAYDDFLVDPDSGVITLSGKLNYDRRDTYTIELLAVDKGIIAAAVEYIFYFYVYLVSSC